MSLRFVAIGDSTVEGLMDLTDDGGYRGWADRLAGHLAGAHPAVTYANLAVRGQTAAQVRSTQLAPAVALKPDIAVVVAGVNDLLRPTVDATALRRDIHAMHATLRACGARVVTFTMPDMARVAPLARFLRPRLELLNAILGEAAALGTTVVDLAAEPVAGDPALWHDDRLHANSEGHRRTALALAEALGLDGGDWRSPLPNTAPPPWWRVAGGEARWAAGHLLPWAWRHLRGQSSGTGQTGKRPDLLPV